MRLSRKKIKILQFLCFHFWLLPRPYQHWCGGLSEYWWICGHMTGCGCVFDSCRFLGNIVCSISSYAVDGLKGCLWTSLRVVAYFTSYACPTAFWCEYPNCQSHDRKSLYVRTEICPKLYSNVQPEHLNEEELYVNVSWLLSHRLSVSQPADLLGFFYTTISTVYREWCEKGKKIQWVSPAFIK